MKPKTLLTYEKTDVDSRTAVVIEPRLARLFTVRMKLKAIGEEASAKVGPKTPAAWIVAVQADALVVQLQVGRQLHVLGKLDVGAMPDAARRREIVQALKAEGVLDAAEVTQFVRRHPDKARLAVLREAVAAKLKAIETLKGELMSLKVELAGSGG